MTVSSSDVILCVITEPENRHSENYDCMILRRFDVFYRVVLSDFSHEHSFDHSAHDIR